eukprot:6342275-Ditylum_brightwellii.AAC.1
MASIKGNPIFLCSGKYCEMTRWKDGLKHDSCKRLHVIIDRGNGQEKQQPKVEKKLKGLCTILAKCQNGFEDHVQGLMSIIEKVLEKAVAKQAELGHKIKYTFIHFPNDSRVHNDEVR